MRILFLLALWSLVMVVSAPAGESTPKRGFVDLVCKSPSGDELRYVAFIPHDYDGTKAYPLILFLHGSGETDAENKNKKQVAVGLGPAIKKREKDFPFIAVFPQSRKRNWAAMSSDGQDALTILADVQKLFKVDEKRFYLTGLSMGGFGTWDIAATYPDKWAAIAPICGGGNVKNAEKLAKLPIWCFHGDADTAVKVERSREMIAAVKKAGGEPRYDEYPGVGHNSWDQAYANPKLYEWFLSHSRK